MWLGVDIGQVLQPLLCCGRQVSVGFWVEGLGWVYLEFDDYSNDGKGG